MTRVSASCSYLRRRRALPHLGGQEHRLQEASVRGAHALAVQTRPRRLGDGERALLGAAVDEILLIIILTLNLKACFVFRRRVLTSGNLSRRPTTAPPWTDSTQTVSGCVCLKCCTRGTFLGRLSLRCSVQTAVCHLAAAARPECSHRCKTSSSKSKASRIVFTATHNQNFPVCFSSCCGAACSLLFTSFSSAFVLQSFLYLLPCLCVNLLRDSLNLPGFSTSESFKRMELLPLPPPPPPCPVCKSAFCLAELDAGFQPYGYPGDMPMDGLDGNMMGDDYGASMAFERQPYA